MAADATARFAIELSAPTSGADGLAASLEKLKAKIQEDQKALSGLQAALKNLQGGASVNIQAVKNLQNQIAARKASLASAQESFVNLGGSFGDTAKAAEAAGGGISDIAGAATMAGGPLGGLIGKGSQLIQTFGKLGVAGVAIIAVVAIAALVTAAIAAVVALARFGLAAADAARSAGIFREAATGSAAGGKALGAVVDQLAAKLATPREELEKLGLALARSGLTGSALASAFSSIATASAVMGDAAGSALQSIIDRARVSKRFLLSAFDLKGTGLALQDVGQALAKRLGISVQSAMAALQSGQVKLNDGLAAMDDAVQSKFGGLAAKQALGFGVQMEKLRENLTRLFADVNIEPFLKGLKEITSLFDQNSATGKALKVLFESLLNPLFAGLGKLAPFFKGVFQGMVIITLMFAIGVLKAKNALNELFGGKALGGLITLENGLIAGKIAMVLIGSAVAALTILLGILAVAMFLVALPFVVAGAVIVAVVYGIVTAISFLIDTATAVYNAVTAIDFAGAASNIVEGFVNGLIAGGGAIVEAAKNLALGALNTIKGVLGIASPSKEMMKLAGFTTEGFQGGIEAGTDDVQDAMSTMVSIPTGSSSSVAGEKDVTNSRSSAVTVNLNGPIYIGSNRDLADAETERGVIELFERAVAAIGLSPGGAMT